jgi:metal-responsive CopG/Arc/MetJ family transcriptional regulator
MKPVQIMLDEELLRRLDATPEVEREGRSAVVRRAVAEYLEIGEIELGYSELVEGRLLMSPSPVPGLNRAAFRK